jgi:hypothetical protein
MTRRGRGLRERQRKNEQRKVEGFDWKETYGITIHHYFYPREVLPGKLLSHRKNIFSIGTVKRQVDHPSDRPSPVASCV